MPLPCLPAEVGDKIEDSSATLGGNYYSSLLIILCLFAYFNTIQGVSRDGKAKPSYTHSSFPFCEYHCC